MREIELKAHVSDRPRTEITIDSFASCAGSVEKDDVYWFNPALSPAAQTVRVRRQKMTAPDGTQTAETLVTCKRKERREGIEVNDETEFSISDAVSFELLLREQGYKVARKKTKQVKQWRFEDVLIELCAVDGLGCFIEIEIRAECEAVTHVESCRKKLLQVLAKSGIGEECIETAYYSELLERAAANLSFRN